MAPPEENKHITRIKRILTCFLPVTCTDSESKSTNLTCDSFCSSDSTGPAPMPTPISAATSHSLVCTMPPYVSSRHRSNQRPREPRRSNAEECHFVTIESEAWMEVLAKEDIAFMDWEPPVTRRYSPNVETSSGGDSSNSGSNSGNHGNGGGGGRMSEQGHITVQIARRPLPGQQEGLTYIRYYRTADGMPSTRV